MNSIKKIFLGGVDGYVGRLTSGSFYVSVFFVFLVSFFQEVDFFPRTLIEFNFNLANFNAFVFWLSLLFCVSFGVHLLLKTFNKDARYLNSLYMVSWSTFYFFRIMIAIFTAIFLSSMGDKLFHPISYGVTILLLVYGALIIFKFFASQIHFVVIFNHLKWWHALLSLVITGSLYFGFNFVTKSVVTPLIKKKYSIENSTSLVANKHLSTFYIYRSFEDENEKKQWFLHKQNELREIAKEGKRGEIGDLLIQAIQEGEKKFGRDDEAVSAFHYHYGKLMLGIDK